MVRRPTPIPLITLALVALLAVGPLSVYAVALQDEGGTGGTGSGTTNTSNTNAANTNASNVNAGTNVNRGLEAAKLRVCQNREAAINRIQERIVRRAERHLEVFGSIAQRVEAFYVRRGLTVTNYNELVGAVNAKRAPTQTQLEALKLRVVFSCTDNDPRGMVTTFQQQRANAITALKEFQTAVRNLIVAVKSVVGSTNANANASNTN